MRRMRRILWIVLCVALFELLKGVAIWESFFIYLIPGLLILLFGLPHGATDHMLSNFTKSKALSGRVTIPFISMYLTIILVYAGIWYYSPEVGLLIFLLMSAYHFGETQWIGAEVQTHNVILVRAQHFSWGVLLLSTLFVVHETDTLSFLSGLIDSEIAAASVTVTTWWVWPFSFFLTGLLSAVIYQGNTLLLQLAEFVALIVLFFMTELIFAFSIFFTLFHSRDTIIQMMQIINPKSSNRLTWSRFYKYALPFTMLSLIGIAIIIFIIHQIQPNIHYITLFFVMISLVTAPHMWIIERFYHSRK